MSNWIYDTKILPALGTGYFLDLVAHLSHIDYLLLEAISILPLKTKLLLHRKQARISVSPTKFTQKSYFGQ